MLISGTARFIGAKGKTSKKRVRTDKQDGQKKILQDNQIHRQTDMIEGKSCITQQ